jgi:hypothetical protein
LKALDLVKVEAAGLRTSKEGRINRQVDAQCYFAILPEQVFDALC